MNILKKYRKVFLFLFIVSVSLLLSILIVLLVNSAVFELYLGDGPAIAFLGSNGTNRYKQAL